MRACDFGTPSWAWEVQAFRFGLGTSAILLGSNADPHGCMDDMRRGCKETWSTLCLGFRVSEGGSSLLIEA